MFDSREIQIVLLLWCGLFNLIAALYMGISTSFEPHKRRRLLLMQLACAVLMFSDAVAWLYRGYPGAVGYWMVRVSNFLVFLFSNLVLMLFHSFVCCSLFPAGVPSSGRLRRRIGAGYGVAAAGMLMVVVSQFTGLYYYFDAENFYHRTAWHPVSLLFSVVVMLLDAGLLMQYRRNMDRRLYLSMLSYIVLPFCAVVSMFFFYGVSLINMAASVSTILIFLSSVAEQNERMIRQAEELAEDRVAIMLSQIQPHFLYNALTTIKYLCGRQDPRAEETVARFARYLRGNMDSLSLRAPIPFERELDHLENYLAIERLRFPNVKIVYQIAASGFSLPALTVQPLVENAIRYGVNRKKGGEGTVTVSSWETEGDFYVSVQDDGVGFDPMQKQYDGRSHIGISNTRQRVETMCGGELTIRSVTGSGTTVTIRLPKERKKAGKPREKAKLWKQT